MGSEAMEAESAREAPECLECGVCCFSTLDRYVAVSGTDHERLGDDAERLVQFIGNRAFMRIVDGHCAALVVDRAAGHFVCSVYERRPAICRDLERGGRECAGERAMKGARPQRLLEVIRADGRGRRPP